MEGSHSGRVQQFTKLPFGAIRPRVRIPLPPPKIRIEPEAHQPGAEVVECSGLLNRRPLPVREFESHRFRQESYFKK